MRFVERFRQKYFPEHARARGADAAFVLRVHAGRGNSVFVFRGSATASGTPYWAGPEKTATAMRFSLSSARICGGPCRRGRPISAACSTRAIRDMGTDIRAFLAKTALWCRGRTPTCPLCQQRRHAVPLVKQLRAMKVVVVGPAHLRAVNRTLFPYDHFIEIPLKNCYTARRETEAQVREYFNRSGPAVFAFSASIDHQCSIHRLFPLMGPSSWLIDFGSLWDVYVGVKSRGGYASG